MPAATRSSFSSKNTLFFLLSLLAGARMIEAFKSVALANAGPSFKAGAQADGAAFLDLDGDSYPDFLTTLPRNNSVIVLPGGRKTLSADDALLTFKLPTDIDETVAEVASADVDDDMDRDVIISTQLWSGTASGILAWILPGPFTAGEVVDVSTRGVKIYRTPTNDLYNYHSVRVAFNASGKGRYDVMLTDPGYGAMGDGRGYLISSGFASDIDLDTSADVVVYEGPAGEGAQFGTDVTFVNNFGEEDYIVWTALGFNNQTGCACFYGALNRALGTTVTCDEANVILEGVSPGGALGTSVDATVDADGNGRLMISAPGSVVYDDDAVSGNVFVLSGFVSNLMNTLVLTGSAGHGFVVRFATAATDKLLYLMTNPQGNADSGWVHVVSEDEVSGLTGEVDCSTLGRQYSGANTEGAGAELSLVGDLTGLGDPWVLSGDFYTQSAHLFLAEASSTSSSSNHDADYGLVIGLAVGIAGFIVACCILTGGHKRLYSGKVCSGETSGKEDNAYTAMSLFKPTSSSKSTGNANLLDEEGSFLGPVANL